MNRLLAVAAVFALFIAGIAVGALGTHLFYDRQIAHPGDFPMMSHRVFFDRMRDRLRLTSEQKKTIDDILERTHEKATDLRHEIQPHIHALMDRAHEEIEGILSPEQRKKFKSLVERHRRRAERFLLGPPGGRPHGPGHGPGHGRRWGRGPSDDPPGRPGETPPGSPPEGLQDERPEPST